MRSIGGQKDQIASLDGGFPAMPILKYTAPPEHQDCNQIGYDAIGVGMALIRLEHESARPNGSSLGLWGSSVHDILAEEGS
jgi:hypothetical protein